MSLDRKRRIKVAFLSTDNREHWRKYDVPSPLLPPAQATLLRGFSSLPEVEIHHISCSRRPLSAPHSEWENFHYHSVRVPHVGWGRSLHIGCVLAVRKFLAELQPDIVHGQGTENENALCAAHSGFPNVVTIHGNMAHLYGQDLLGAKGIYRIASWLTARREDHALARTKGVFCNSRHTQQLVENRTPQTWLVPNALRETFLDSPLPNRTSSESPRLINIGYINRNKRQIEILTHLAKLHQQGYKFKISFIGTPCSNNEWLEVFEPAREKGWAEHLGYLSAEEIRTLMDQSDALVHFPREEAFGLVVAEALARNLRVFGSNIGGLKDIGHDIEGCALFDTPSDLEIGLRDWFSIGSPANSLSQGIMKERYAPEVVAKRHLEIYKEVLNWSSTD